MISLDIVDSQVHLNRLGSDWATADPELTIAAGVAAMDAVGVSAALIDERWGAHILGAGRHSHRLPNGVLRHSFPFGELAVARHPKRFAYLGRVERNDPELPQVMADLRRRPHCIAVRIEPTPQTGELEPFARGEYENFFAAAQACGMPVFVRTTGHVDLLAPYLARFSEAQVILDHCGSANPAPATWAERMRQLDSVLALASFPNLALKWCKAPTRISMQPYPYADLMPVLRTVIDAYGKKRVMWAGDPTQTGAQHSWADSLYYLLHAPVINEDEKAWLLGRAARSILCWPLS